MSTLRYIPVDIINLISGYLGYLPDRVSRNWRDAMSECTVLNVLKHRYGTMETLIANCEYEPTYDNEINFAMRYIDTPVGIPYDVLAVGREAAYKGILGIIKWIHTKDIPNWSDIVIIAIYSNHLHIVEWISENVGEQPDWNSLVLDAAESGNIRMIEYIATNILDTPNWTAIALYAAGSNYLDVLKWCTHKDDINWTNVACGAAQRQYLDIVKWIHSQYLIDMNEVANTATYGGYTDIVLWLLDHGATDTDRFISTAMVNNHYDLVEQIIDHML